MKKLIVLALLACFGSAALAGGGVVAIGASQDNSLYEDNAGGLSNGAGEYLFTGVTALDSIRRGLIQFDIAGNVPAGATIDNVTLTLAMSMTIAGAEDVGLHRVEQAWGESTSDAPGEEGIGGTAERGDATWVHAILGTSLWNTLGGDFDPAPSAVTSVDQAGAYDWTGMHADVQAWLDDPSSNFGWVIVGNESTQITAKRFNSRENGSEATRPVLVIEYSAAPAVPAVGPWGVAAAALALLGAGTFAIRRRN
jgi:hypothetical protein